MNIVLSFNLNVLSSRSSFTFWTNLLTIQGTLNEDIENKKFSTVCVSFLVLAVDSWYCHRSLAVGT